MVEPPQPGCHFVLSRAVPLNSSANFRFHAPATPIGLGGVGAGVGAGAGAGVVVLVGVPGRPAAGGGTVQPTAAMAARLRTGSRRRESTRALSAGRTRRRSAKRVVRILGKYPPRLPTPSALTVVTWLVCRVGKRSHQRCRHHHHRER